MKRLTIAAIVIAGLASAGVAVAPSIEGGAQGATAGPVKVTDSHTCRTAVV